MEDVEELGEKDYLLSFEALARLAVHDSDPRVRLLAVRTLWEYEHKDLISLFLDLLEADRDEEVQAGAASALGRFVYAGELEEIPSETLHEIEDRLLRVTQDASSVLIRRRALESLGFSSREEVAGLIESAYTSGSKDWMVSALLAMGRSANERWEPQVLAMLESSQTAIRSEAVRAAGELEISESVPRLLELLDDPEDSVRFASIWSLSQIGGEGVGEALQQLFETTEDEEEAEYIETALENLAFTEGAPPLRLLDLPKGGVEEDDLDLDLDLDLEDELFDLLAEDDEDLID
jgi:HEAT repeat protein